MTSNRILTLGAAFALVLFTAGGCGGKKTDAPLPTCTDGTKNGTETGVDCGGATCVAQGKPCPNGGGCLAATDCASSYCDATYHCAAACGGAAAACTTGGDCCSGFCNGTVCADALCTGNGQPCTSPAQCCTGLCSTTCQAPPSCALQANGDTCTAGSQCCSGYCGAGGLCADPCILNGSSCADDASCCSSSCDAGTCGDPCKAVGLGCGADSECCTGICTGTPTKACAAAPSCTVDGQPCPVSPGACCSGLCDTGTNECAKPCSGDGLTCSFGSDCCSGYCTPGKLCDRPPTCKANAVACAGDAECCEGYCSPISNTCATPVSTCADPSANCAANADCCSGSCAAGKCTTTAFCKVPGFACANGAECCSGSCSGGICSDTLCKPLSTACTTTAGVSGECCSGLCPAGTCAAVPGGACKTLGDSCTLAADCCSTNCQGGRCTPAYLCHAPDDICYSDADCCSGLCDGVAPAPGRCVLPTGGCNQDGAPCAGASNCCTRLCVDMGSGVTVCKPSSGCRMTGDYCDPAAFVTATACTAGNQATVCAPFGTNSTCTGGFCTNPNAACCGGSPDAVRADGYDIRCEPKQDGAPTSCTGGTSCNPPGNICGAAGDPASQNCCDGKKAVCKRDMNGIARCFGGGSAACPNGYDWSNPACCIGTAPGTSGRDNVCQFRDQCCDAVPCVPGSDGVLRCTAPTCTPLHGACEGVDDGACCANTSCAFNGTSFTCEIPTGCTDNGFACTVASDCCSNNCSGGFCAPPCVGGDGACTFDECCSGLTCFKDPPTATSGVCRPVSSCAGSGAACNAVTPCCSAAEQCLAGVCAVPPTCKAQYASCVPTDTCCSTPAGMSCMEADGVTCAPGSITCVCDNCSAASGSCNPSASPTGCCLGLTCSGTGTTGTCAACALLGSSCTSAADGTGDTCCSTLHCRDATGSAATCATSPNACTCDACIPLAQPCTYGGAACCGRMDMCLTPAITGCGPTDADCTCQTNG